MCFFIHQDHREVKIATEDIVCYKTLLESLSDGTIRSPYLNKLYFKKADTHPKILKEDFFGILWNHEIHTGLHSYSTANAAFNYTRYGYTIHKAVIPKGTEYYYNSRDNEYVSLKLKVWKKNLNK
jgi:hypothetical protein